MQRERQKGNLVILLHYGMQFMCLGLELNIRMQKHGWVWEKKIYAVRGKEFITGY